jgi:hypothetical protein
MIDSHDHDWLYDPDSEYNKEERKQLIMSTNSDKTRLYFTDDLLKDYWGGEGDYQRSLDEWAGDEDE